VGASRSGEQRVHLAVDEVHVGNTADEVSKEWARLAGWQAAHNHCLLTRSVDA
jgi:hypothetical protein